MAEHPDFLIDRSLGRKHLAAALSGLGLTVHSLASVNGEAAAQELDDETNREKLHRLVDELSEAEVTPTLRLVETQRHDPLLQAVASAPEDDEPWTDEDDAAVAESQADVAAGRTLSHEEMLRKYR